MRNIVGGKVLTPETYAPTVSLTRKPPARENKMTAAETFTTATAQIVANTGCTVEAAVSYLFRKMSAERPEMLLKVAVSAGLVEVR